MSLRRNDCAAGMTSGIFEANKIIIPVPHHLQLEKETGCHQVDVSDISQSFDASGGKVDEPCQKQYRAINYPKEPTFHTKYHQVASTEQTCKNKHMDKSYNSSTSPKLNDKKHQSFSKAEDESINEKQSNTTQFANSSELVEYLKRQDAKLDAIQEQVFQALSPSSKCVGASSQGESSSSDASLAVLRTEHSPSGGLSASREELLIKCLLSQGEQIQKLQEQVNWLMLNVAGGGEKANSNPPSLDGSNNPSIKNPDVLEGFLEKVTHDDNSTGISHKDAEVTKESTSTMTSMTFNGNEKLVIHKKLTVVTDKFQKEVSAQCSMYTNASPQKDTPNKKPSSKEKKSSKKLQKSTKSSPQCKCRRKSLNESESSDVASPNEKRILPSPIRRNSPSIKENLDKEGNVITESKIEQYVPNFGNILKHVNEMIAEKTEDLPVKPCKKTTPKGVSKPKSKKSPLHKISPDKECIHPRRSSTSSNSSHDSTHMTPKDRKQRPSLNKSHRTSREEESYHVTPRYGLSSPNLSVSTIRYLESYGLVRQCRGKHNDSKRN